VYFFFNLALTIYNKFVLAGDFPFPYTLTAVHALSGSVGSFLCWKRGLFSMVTLTTRETVQIILFSGLYTINIIVSNVSLYELWMAKLIVDT
jgi:Triose-phosphate Transporter family